MLTEKNQFYVKYQQNLLSFRTHYQIINGNEFWTLKPTDKQCGNGRSQVDLFGFY